MQSIVAKARHYEEKNLFTEAVGQWDILRNIYPKYPGIEVEVAQLMKRREQQSKEESKARRLKRSTARWMRVTSRAPAIFRRTR